MIQRIQTVHLLIAAALLGLFLGLGGAWLGGLAANFPWVAIAAHVLAGLAAALALAAIFLYKNRPTQMKLISAAAVLDLLLALLAAGALAAVAMGGEGLAAEELAEASVALLPAFAYVFLALARLGVRRDIELVRSMDRLR